MTHGATLHAANGQQAASPQTDRVACFLLRILEEGAQAAVSSKATVMAHSFTFSVGTRESCSSHSYVKGGTMNILEMLTILRSIRTHFTARCSFQAS